MDKQNTVQQLFQSGIMLYEKKRYNDAIRKFQKVIEFDSVDANAYYNWGLSLHNLNKYNEAIQKFKKATELNPSFADAYRTWGLTLNKQNKFEEAIAKFRTAAELNPNDPDVYNYWGSVLYDQKKNTEAIQKFKKAIERNSDHVDAYYNWGLALNALNRHNEAIQKYQKAIELDSDDADAYYSWGLALRKLNRLDEAIQKFKKATELKPSSVDAYRDWANILYEQSKFKEAIALYNTATELNPKEPDLYNLWGNLLFDQRKFQEAILKYKKAIDCNSKYSYSYFNWGLVLQEQKEYEEACEKFYKVIEFDPEFTDAYYSLGNLFHDQKKYDQAIKKFKKVLEMDPDHADAYFSWGNTLADLRQYNAAMEKYETAAKKKKNQDFAFAYHNIAFYSFKLGLYKKGWEGWNMALKAYEKNHNKEYPRNNADHFYNYGFILHEYFGNLSEAEKIYLEGLNIDDKDTEILAGLVHLYLEVSMLSEDVESENDGNGFRFKMWNKKNSYSESRAAIYHKAWQFFRETEKILKKRIATTKNVENHLQLGSLYLTMKQFDEAEKQFKAALEIDGHESTAYEELGVLYSLQEDYNSALKYLKRSANLDPFNFKILSNLADIYFKLGRKSKAEEEYLRILKRNNNHFDSHVGLGEVYTEMGDDDDTDKYYLAIDHYSKGINNLLSDAPSKRLKRNELAAAYYSRGYTRIKLYESTTFKQDASLLSSAKNDFNRCIHYNPGHFKARTAIKKIESKIGKYTPQRLLESIGPWSIFLLSLIVFIFTQFSFFFSGSANLTFFNTSLSIQSIEVGMFVVLTFGSLLFMVVGLYLPQVLKLKVGSIELEKSAIEHVTSPGHKTSTSLLEIRK